jgi:hypothetical protein
MNRRIARLCCMLASIMILASIPVAAQFIDCETLTDGSCLAERGFCHFSINAWKNNVCYFDCNWDADIQWSDLLEYWDDVIEYCNTYGQDGTCLQGIAYVMEWGYNIQLQWTGCRDGCDAYVQPYHDVCDNMVYPWCLAQCPNNP